MNDPYFVPPDLNSYDSNKDCRVYLYSSSAAVEMAFVVDNWVSGYIIDTYNTTDITFSPVVHATSGTEWGLATTCIDFINLLNGFIIGADTLHFKIKTD